MNLYRILITLLTLSLIFNSNLLAQNQSKKSSLSEGVRLIKDIEYARRDGISLKLDLYVPASAQEKNPVIVFIHGAVGKMEVKTQVNKVLGWFPWFCYSEY